MPKALLAPAPHLQCLPSSGQALNLRTSLQEDFQDISIGNDLRAPTSCSHPQFLVSRAFFSQIRYMQGDLSPVSCTVEFPAPNRHWEKHGL